MFFVYILRCSNGRPYIGCTQNIKERLARHRNGRAPTTSRILPVKLISCIIFSNKYVAYNFEKYLKSGSGRAFIERHFLYASKNK